MSKPIAGLNKLTKQESKSMVEAFREAYADGSPEFRAYVDKARKILLAKKHLHLGPLGVDELICSTLMEVARQSEMING